MVLYQSCSEETEEKNLGFFSRLMKGEVSLAYSYWLFYSLPLGVADSFSQYFEANNAKDISFALDIFLIFYSVLALIFVWRSANNYEGRKLWAILAKIIVVFSLIFYILALIGKFGEKPVVSEEPSQSTAKIISTEQIIQNEKNIGDEDLLKEKIELMKKYLPTMLDNNVQLEAAEIKNGNVHFYYILASKNLEEINLAQFSELVTPSLVSFSCKSKDIEYSPRKNRDIIYHYFDKSRKFVSSITVKDADCR